MATLYIDAPENKNQFKTVAAAVYKTLGQVDPLKAEIVYLNAEEMQKLNASSRGVNSVTDVLSFPSIENARGKVLLKKDNPYCIDGNRLFIGSIALCREKIASQAKELGHSEERETVYLTVHGLMHLFGYDHIEENDKKQMREKEKEALSLLGITE